MNPKYRSITQMEIVINLNLQIFCRENGEIYQYKD